LNIFANFHRHQSISLVRRDKTPEELIVHMCLTYGVQVAFYQFNDRLWLRYCANVYNKRDDYLKLKDALLDMFAVL